MPLDEKRCEIILAQMKSMDIQVRLDGINEARAMFSNTFNPSMNDVGWARAAYIIESFYNLIREELQVKQIRIKADLNSDITAKVKPDSGSKPKKAKPAALDMNAMMASFMMLKNNGELDKK